MDDVIEVIEEDDDVVIVVEQFIHVYELCPFSPTNFGARTTNKKNSFCASSPSSTSNGMALLNSRSKSELTLDRLLILTRETLVDHFPFRLQADSISPLFVPRLLFKMECSDEQLRHLFRTVHQLLMFPCDQLTYIVPQHFVDLLFQEFLSWMNRDQGANGVGGDGDDDGSDENARHASDDSIQWLSHGVLGQNGMVFIPVRELDRVMRSLQKSVKGKSNGPRDEFIVSIDTFIKILKTEMLFGRSLPGDHSALLSSVNIVDDDTDESSDESSDSDDDDSESDNNEEEKDDNNDNDKNSNKDAREGENGDNDSDSESDSESDSDSDSDCDDETDEDDEPVTIYPVPFLSLEELIRMLEKDQQSKLDKTLSKMKDLRATTCGQDGAFTCDQMLTNSKDGGLLVYFQRYSKLMIEIEGLIVVHRETRDIFCVEYLLPETDMLTVLCRPVKSLVGMRAMSSWTTYLESYVNDHITHSDAAWNKHNRICIPCHSLLMFPCTKQIIDILANKHMVREVMDSLLQQRRIVEILEDDLQLSFDMDLTIHALVTQDFSNMVSCGFELNKKLCHIGKYGISLAMTKLLIQYMASNGVDPCDPRCNSSQKDDLDSKLRRIANDAKLENYVLSMPDQPLTDEQTLHAMYAILGSVLITKDGMRRLIRFCKHFFYGDVNLKPKNKKGKVELGDNILQNLQTVKTNYSNLLSDNHIRKTVIELGMKTLQLTVLLHVAANSPHLSFTEIEQQFNYLISANSLIKVTNSFRGVSFIGVPREDVFPLLIGLVFMDSGLSFHSIQSGDQIPECDTKMDLIDKYYLKIIDLTPKQAKKSSPTGASQMIRASEAKDFVSKQLKLVKSKQAEDIKILSGLKSELEALKKRAAKKSKQLETIGKIDVQLLSFKGTSVPAKLIQAKVDTILSSVTAMNDGAIIDGEGATNRTNVETITSSDSERSSSSDSSDSDSSDSSDSSSDSDNNIRTRSRTNEHHRRTQENERARSQKRKGRNEKKRKKKRRKQ